MFPPKEHAFLHPQEVEAENEAGIVEVLCVASAAYAMNWDIKGAKQLAIEAISRAK